VSRFWEDAIGVLETAARGDGEELGILVDDAGAIRIVPAAGWRTDALQAHYGARTVYQVSHPPSGVRVTGRSGRRSCVLEESAMALLVT
jgi:hypothetical protein